MKLAYYLPANMVANAELSALYPEWPPEKILAKTGIASRHVVGEGETAVDLAEAAAKKLFAENGVTSGEIDFVLLCTQSPDYKLPSSACILQDRLGIPKSAGALDYDLGCSGFVYGLALAKGLVVGGMAKKVLLLTAETYSKYIHPMDKSVRTIFGDGASATLIDEAAAKSIGNFVFGTDGSGADKLIVRTGGAREPLLDPSGNPTLNPQPLHVLHVLHGSTPNPQPSTLNSQLSTTPTPTPNPPQPDSSGNLRTRHNIYMAGPDIFNFTLDIVPKTMDEVCAKNGLIRDDIDLFVFHQANKFMLDTIRKVNLIPRAKFYIDLEDTGNTVSSTIPIALVRAQEKGVLHPGMKVMVMGFGVGLSWGATIINF